MPGARASHEQLLHRNLQRFRGGLVVKAHRLCVALNFRLESNKEEEASQEAIWEELDLTHTPWGNPECGYLGSKGTNVDVNERLK